MCLKTSTTELLSISNSNHVNIIFSNALSVIFKLNMCRSSQLIYRLYHHKSKIYFIDVNKMALKSSFFSICCEGHRTVVYNF